MVESSDQRNVADKIIRCTSVTNFWAPYQVCRSPSPRPECFHSLVDLHLTKLYTGQLIWCCMHANQSFTKVIKCLTEKQIWNFHTTIFKGLSCCQIKTDFLQVDERHWWLLKFFFVKFQLSNEHQLFWLWACLKKMRSDFFLTIWKMHISLSSHVQNGGTVFLQNY